MQYGPIKPDIELIDAESTTIDLLSEFELAGWRFCKLDLEGGEFFALRGARKSLARYHPMIVFENGLSAPAQVYGYSKEDFFAFFEGIGYRLYDLFGRPFTTAEWGLPNIPWEFIGVEDGSEDHVFIRSEFPDLLAKTTEATIRSVDRIELGSR
jgi:hypothetical protein